ncbi:MAG: polymer-forming cytoskeletal protein [Spirochaetales bacterium]|nr:polymer-forming cytoskeletal protein [Spirochaetales bacterium]
MAKSREPQRVDRAVTRFSENTRFEGILKYANSLRIDGLFKGEIESPGSLYIDRDAIVRADIKVSSIRVQGAVHGNITARESVEILEGGKVFGNIRTRKLKIDDGVLFSGKCEMIKDADTIDVFSANVSKLKNTVELF